MTQPWIAGDGQAFLHSADALHAGLTVMLIATPRNELSTCHSEEHLSKVTSRNVDAFDYLPVLDRTDTDGKIVGLFHAAPFFEELPPDRRVVDVQEPLTEEHAIGGDASILDFVRDADRRPCRLVFSGAQISGLVSLSDLQKLPVRATLFALITGLELTMATAIRRQHSSDNTWKELLSEGRRQKIEEEVSASLKGDGYVDDLLFTQFCDKIDILAKTLPSNIGRGSFRKDMSRIEDLRNDVAHANDYASTRKSAESVCERVRTLLARESELITLMQKSPK